MNIIFLDVDGVLNSIRKLQEVYIQTGKPHSGINYPFDEKCMKNLKYIVKKTNAKIVVTSKWRKYDDHKKRLLEEFEKYNLSSKIIGYTKDLGNRVQEIKDYLSTLDENINFIILDDFVYMEDLVEYLVSTNAYFGITKQDADIAIKKLTRQ